eukprot:2026478-Pleurochrysis_carterae.AAC.1
MEREEERSWNPGGAGSIAHPSTPPPSNVISPTEPSASIEKAAEQWRASRPLPPCLPPCLPCGRTAVRARMAGARVAALRPPTVRLWPSGRTCPKGRQEAFKTGWTRVASTGWAQAHAG